MFEIIMFRKFDNLFFYIDMVMKYALYCILYFCSIYICKYRNLRIL